MRPYHLHAAAWQAARQRNVARKVGSERARMRRLGNVRGSSADRVLDKSLDGPPLCLFAGRNDADVRSCLFNVCMLRVAQFCFECMLCGYNKIDCSRSMSTFVSLSLFLFVANVRNDINMLPRLPPCNQLHDEMKSYCQYANDVSCNSSDGFVTSQSLQKL